MLQKSDESTLELLTSEFECGVSQGRKQVALGIKLVGCEVLNNCSCKTCFEWKLTEDCMIHLLTLANK